MKLMLIYLGLSAACVLLFFVAPHYRWTRETRKSATLSGIYGDFFKYIPALLASSKAVFVLLPFAGMAAAFYPVVMVAMVQWLLAGQHTSGGVPFVAGGITAIAGALMSFVMMLISHMNFSWGGGSGKKSTIFFFLIPAFQITFALCSIVIGSSATFAGWVTRLLGV